MKRRGRAVRRSADVPFRDRRPMDLTEAETERLANVARLSPRGDGLRLAVEVREAGQVYWIRRKREGDRREPVSVRIRTLRRKAGALEQRKRHPRDIVFEDVERWAGVGSLAELGSLAAERWGLLGPREMAAKLRELADRLPDIVANPTKIDLVVLEFVNHLAKAWREIAKRPVVIGRAPVVDSPEGEEVIESPFLRFARAALAVVDPPLAARNTLHRAVQHMLAFDHQCTIMSAAGENSEFVEETDPSLSNKNLGRSKG